MILLSFDGRTIGWFSREFAYIQTGGKGENQSLIDLGAFDAVAIGFSIHVEKRHSIVYELIPESP